MPAMFEDSLFSSQPQRNSARRRSTVAASIGIQVALVAAIIAVPAFHPETLPLIVAAPKPIQLLRKPTPPPPKPVAVRISPDSSLSLRMPVAMPVETLRSMIARPDLGSADAPSNLLATGLSTMANNSLPGGFNPSSGPSIRVGPGTSGEPGHAGKPLAVSSGVTRGMLLAEIKPAYPRIAIAAHIAGTVVLSAIIDKSGRITALQVVSGPDMLRNAALDAVRVARYRPYLLNSEPTEVQTTISVDFRLNG